MPLLMNIERRALEKGLEKGTKSTSKKYIINLLQKRFGSLPENIIRSIDDIDNISLLEQLLLETISVNSIEEFAQLIKDNSSDQGALVST